MNLTLLNIPSFLKRIEGNWDLTENSSEKVLRIDFRKELVRKFQRDRSSLLPSLHYVQDTHGYLPSWALEVIGWHLGVPASEVYGAASTYSELKLEPYKVVDIEVCVGLSCSQLGAGALTDCLDDLIKEEQTKFRYRTVPCAFLCSVGPVLRKNGNWYGRFKPEHITINLM